MWILSTQLRPSKIGEWCALWPFDGCGLHELPQKEALRIFPFFDNDATIGGLFRQLPQYIAATQDVVIECEGEKVEWCRVFQEVLPKWSSCCRLLWLFVDVRILSHSSQTSFHSVMGRRNQNLKTRRKLRSEANSKNFALSHSVTNKEYIGQKYWVYGR